MNADGKRARQIALDHDSGGCRGSADQPNLIDDIAAALAAAERRGEDRVLRWIARFGGNYIPGGGFTSMIEAYRKARRRARGSRS